MIDAVGNIVNVGDIVVCCLGASRNRNNSTLTPCKVVKVTDTYCIIDNVFDIATYGKYSLMDVNIRNRMKLTITISNIADTIKSSLFFLIIPTTIPIAKIIINSKSKIVKLIFFLLKRIS